MKVAIKSCDLIVVGDSEECKNLLLGMTSNPLLDRLYRRYIRRNDVDNTLKLLGEYQVNQKYKTLKNNLLNAIKDQATCAENNLEDYGEYVPVRIVLFDLPYSVIDDDIPLEDYDNNDGEPFWMRPEYIVEKYSKIKKI